VGRVCWPASLCQRPLARGHRLGVVDVVCWSTACMARVKLADDPRRSLTVDVGADADADADDPIQAATRAKERRKGEAAAVV